MTWAVLVSVILAGLIKILMTCLPLGMVEWISKKFEIHSKLDDTSSNISFAGKKIEGEEKRKVIHDYNHAVFMERHYIYPGNEQKFLNPKKSGIPIIIESNYPYKNVKLYIYSFDDRIEVVKQNKKKIIAYRLFSDGFKGGFWDSIKEKQSLV
jgi:hypothetical protein